MHSANPFAVSRSAQSACAGWANRGVGQQLPTGARRAIHCAVVSAVALGLIAGSAAAAAPVTQAIKLDHFGYRPADIKIAIVTANPGSTVEIRTATDAVAFTVPTDGGAIIAKGSDGPASGDTVWWVDFTPFVTLGSYRLYSPSLGVQSYDFDIRADIYYTPARAALKSFYYQRCNTPKAAAYAGAWADASACHVSDATTGSAAGNTNYGTLDLTGGWHDAGDYNKYVWSAASSAILTMLRAYEDNPGALRDDDLNIPESGNGIPDLLDEIKWELDWMRKMQLPSGAALSQMHVNGYASDAPPSADANVRFYQDPTLESGAVAAGTFALASRIYAAAGLTAYAATLRTAALAAWSWLQTQPQNSNEKVWAAAEIFRLDGTQTAARSYVNAYHPSAWAGLFFNVVDYDSHAALTYVQTPGATASVVANMRADIADQVDYIFSSDDRYRNGMPAWSYYWGSNAIRAGYGLFLVSAARLGATGSHTADECVTHALDFLHFFHGQNPLNMVYLSNMAALGGEHSSFQFYHSWFGDSSSALSRNTFLGKPLAIFEPDYPYFKGTDNFGINDNKASSLGPAPGFVPGGPNKDYAGTARPPLGAVYYNRFYRDWADQTEWRARTWEITENSIGYQGPYVALGAYFTGAPACNTNGVCDAGENTSNCPADCPASPALDHYTGYTVTAPLKDINGVAIPGLNRLPAGWVITVDDLDINNADVDDPENFEVRGAKTLFNPALWNTAGPANASGHYLRYAMRPGPESVAPAVNGTFPPPPKYVKRVWQLHNEFGSINVRSRNVSALWLPASQDLNAAPVPPADATHFVCYTVSATRDNTDQTPAGRFRTTLQAFVKDQFDDCALNAAGALSFAGTQAEGKCLVDLKGVAELCNPMNKTAVEPPRQTTAVISQSTASTTTSLLCYTAKLAKRFSSPSAAALANASSGSIIDPKQVTHARRTVKNGNPVHTAPGNLFPNPALLDTITRTLVCVPTDVMAVSPAP